MSFRTTIIAALLVALAPVSGMAADTSILTRAGAVALLVESDPAARDRTSWFRTHMPPVSLFADIQQHHWYAPYVEAAFERGIVRGGQKGEFRPGGVLTAEEAAILFSRAWLNNSPLLLLPWSQGVYYTPTLQDVATAYGMRTPVGPRAMPRAEFLSLVQEMYGPTAVASLPSEATAWSGQQTDVAVIETPQVAATDTPLISRDTPPMTPVRTVSQPPQQTIRPPTQQPAPVMVPAGTDAFTISLPSLGIDALSVHHPSNPFTHQGLLEPLKNGVGHLFSYPGRGGKILIYGHSSSYAWDISPFTKIFRRINELSVGDRVAVTFDGRVHTYEVSEKKTVPARDMASYQNEGDGEELILYTCWPPDSIAERYLVIARPVDAVATR
jgi:LPXTG-site transpeptidase (sortase) family protein